MTTIFIDHLNRAVRIFATREEAFVFAKSVDPRSEDYPERILDVIVIGASRAPSESPINPEDMTALVPGGLPARAGKPEPEPKPTSAPLFDVGDVVRLRSSPHVRMTVGGRGTDLVLGCWTYDCTWHSTTGAPHVYAYREEMLIAAEALPSER